MNEENELHNRNLHISGLLNEEKVDIGNAKVDIENEKVDIESVLSEKGSNFSVKATATAMWKRMLLTAARRLGISELLNGKVDMEDTEVNAENALCIRRHER